MRSRRPGGSSAGRRAARVKRGTSARGTGLFGPWVPYLAVIVMTPWHATEALTPPTMRCGCQSAADGRTDRHVPLGYRRVDTALHPRSPVVRVSHRVVEVAGAEVEDDRWSLASFEE